MAAEFNKSELERMQNEAARRVREMQARAQRAAGGGRESRTSPPQKKEPPRTPGASSHGAGSHKGHSPSSFGRQESSSNSILNLINLKGLDLDGDTSLIAMMILLLSSDKSDELLMLALVYILL